jgi:hypothetical protein
MNARRMCYNNNISAIFFINKKSKLFAVPETVSILQIVAHLSADFKVP